MTVLVGGVGNLYQGDLDLGRRAVERLRSEGVAAHVLVEDFHYGAVAVAQRLQESRPTCVVLVGAAERGRPPGTVERRRIRPVVPPASALQSSVADAVTGYVSMDLLLEVAAGFEALPARTVAIEVEPVLTAPTVEISPEAAAGLEKALELVRVEVRRAPALDVAGEIRELLATDRVEPSAATEAMRDLITELEVVDSEGRWGAAFALRDRARSAIAAGESGEGMTHLDWGLWWGLIEELDRLQGLDLSPVEPAT